MLYEGRKNYLVKNLKGGGALYVYINIFFYNISVPLLVQCCTGKCCTVIAVNILFQLLLEEALVYLFPFFLDVLSCMEKIFIM